MKILKKIVLYMSLFAIFLLINMGAKKQKSITFWAMPNAPNDLHLAWMKQKAYEFERKTGIKVNFEEIGWGDAWPRISTALATGYGADCFQVGTTWNPQFAATGGLAELNIKKFAKENEFFKANLESCKLDGKYYGVPWFAETRCLFYNKNIFSKLRIKPPKTYDELLEVCEKITNELGKGKAISLAGTAAWDLLHNWSILFWSNGGSLLNEDYDKASFNTKEGIDALKYYIDLFDRGYADKSNAEYNQPQADADFISEKTAMCFMGPWNIEVIKWNNPKLNYGVVQPPSGPAGKASFSGGSNLVILDSSPNKKEAEKWIKFLLKEENLTDYCRNLSYMMPSKLKYYENRYYSKDNWKTFYDTLNYATPYPSIGNWGWVEIGLVDEIKNALKEYIDGNYNDQTAEKHIEKAAKYVNKALDDNSRYLNVKKKDKSKKKTKERKADVEITFWAMPNAPNDIHVAWMMQKSEEFLEETGIRVKFEEIGWGDAWPRISTALATGYGADCFQVGTTWNPQFAATGGLAKLDINDYGGENAFFDANLISSTYKDIYYGIPWFADTRCLFYNKDYFIDAGVQPPKTYDELLRISNKIIEKKGNGTAIAIAGTNAWDILHNWSILLWSNGGSILNKDRSKTLINSIEGIEGMKYYISLLENNLAPQDCAVYNQPQADAEFINGDVAMCIMGPWNVLGIKNDNPGLDFGVLELPSGPAGKAAFSGGSNLAILEASENKEAAAKWIQFLLREENMIDYCKNLCMMLPVKKNCFEDQYFKDKKFQPFKRALEYSTPYPPLRVWGSLETYFVDEYKNLLQDYADGNYKEELVTEYLNKAAKKINEALLEEHDDDYWIEREKNKVVVRPDNYNPKKKSKVNKKKSNSKKKKRKGIKEIIFWAMPNAPRDVHYQWMLQKGDQFYDETGIFIEFEEVGWGNAWPRIATALASGDGVDCFQVGTTWNPQLAATRGLKELDINDFGGENAFFKANLVSCTYKNKYYGVPWIAETRCLFYNKEYFDELSLNPPKTHDELIKVCEKIKNKYGKGKAISLAGTTAWDLLHNWSIILYQNGGSILNQNNTKAVFNQNEGINAWKFYIDLMRNGYADKRCAEFNQPQADAAFINGDVAMCLMGPWNIAGLANDNPYLEYGIVEPPKGPVNKGSFSGGSNLVILNASSLSKESEEWIKFLIEEKNMIDYCKNLSKMLPAKIKCFNDPYYMANDFQIFKKTLEYSSPYPPLGVWGSVETAIVDELNNCLADYVNGTYDERTVRTYLNKAALKVNSVLNEE